MIKKIICQLWNQRRMNGWIFIELVIVSFFLWTVIDPIYILTADKLIASGYDAHNRYVVKIGNYESSNGNYQAEMNTDSICKESYNRIIRVVRDLPEVKDFSIASSASFPNSGSWNGTQIYNDTADIKNDKYIHTQYYEFYLQDGSNMFRTYGMKDAFTGADINIPADAATRQKVFLSEALARAIFVVEMTSYAPLLAKEGHTQWNPDLIYFNNTEVKPTVGYYTQQMYGQNAGTQYITSHITLSNGQEAVRKRVGVSVVKDEATGDHIVKLVNLLPVEVSSTVKLKGIDLQNPSAVKTLLTGDPKDKQARSVTSAFVDIGGTEFPYTLPAYSFTVIRIHENKGK